MSKRTTPLIVLLCLATTGRAQAPAADDAADVWADLPALAAVDPARAAGPGLGPLPGLSFHPPIPKAQDP